MKYKRKRRSTPRMGVVGGLTEAANNINDNEIYKKTGVRPKARKPYEGGIGQALENFFKGLGNIKFQSL